MSQESIFLLWHVKDKKDINHHKQSWASGKEDIFWGIQIMKESRWCCKQENYSILDVGLWQSKMLFIKQLKDLNKIQKIKFLISDFNPSDPVVCFHPA